MRPLRIVVFAALLVSCGGGPSPYEALTAGPATTAPGPTTSISSGIEPVPPTDAGTAPAAPTTTAAVAAATTPPSTSASGSGVPVLAPPTTASAVPALLAQVGNAGQAIVVTAPALNTSTATLTAYQRTGSTWTVAFGPWPARIGSRGLAPPGEKREGDQHTPSGAYGFDFLFGVDPDPGVQLPYRRVGESIVWVDDPASPLYNQWVDTAAQKVTVSAERMYQPQAYRYGAAIAYNPARTPNLGSAIFLHASTGSATAGCVSLPVDDLVQVLKWLDPARSPRIVMGVG